MDRVADHVAMIRVRRSGFGDRIRRSGFGARMGVRGAL